MDLLTLVILGIAVESITELLTKSEIFKPLQKWANPKVITYLRNEPLPKNFFQKIVSCAYCLSVWVAAFVILVYTLLPTPIGLSILLVFTLHRLSNWAHHLFELLFWKAYEFKDKHD